ncbi:hypothetical protein GOBAR_AA34524 [Gossypium barbadense]|uniref:ATPase family AAA domain-containing protein n=1 Tax=Gossypium barbadense TaxID=3634 RepID=A0A2P5W4Y7_GOSBA|nr:hypothetical protein GOBAR_AA34524 [Gossypium barbadense]
MDAPTCKKDKNKLNNLVQPLGSIDFWYYIAKALREISSSSNAKKAFELMKKQEETRQAELAARAAEFKATQAQAETVRSLLKSLYLDG